MPEPIEYRDRRYRVWYVSEVAWLKVVSPSIDLTLVIRFEHECEERFARWIGGDDWLQPAALDRLFVEAEPVAPADATPAQATANVQKPPEAPIAIRLQWIRAVAEIGPDALELFEQQTFTQWDRTSLVAVRRAIDPLLTMTDDDSAVGPAPPETVTLWVNRVATMDREQLDDFERCTFAAWDRASLCDLRWRLIDGSASSPAKPSVVPGSLSPARTERRRHL